MYTTARTVMTSEVMNRDVGWIRSANDVEQKIDEAIHKAAYIIAAENENTKVGIRQVVITPLDLGGMTFLAVTVIGEWK